MSLMFEDITETWNPLAMKCRHGCSYCWALDFIKQKPVVSKKYNGKAKVVEYELKRVKRFKETDFVFVCSMTDLFGEWVPSEWIKQIIKATYDSPSRFLFLTKNPGRYNEFLHLFDKDKHYLGATIETDWDYGVSVAPPPMKRLLIMSELIYPLKVISAEPIQEFSHVFDDLLVNIYPSILYVGYDNYSNNLTEPSLEKTTELIKDLRDLNINVVEKTLREAIS